MKFTETPLKGAFVIELEPRGDERGWFSRMFCVNEFDQHRLRRDIVQVNNSFSKDKGTLRGLHYQLAPGGEDKIVRCVRGAFLDVIVDVREKSPSRLQHFSIELTADNRKMLYVPRGFAHGFLTLTDDTEALYMVTGFYSPQHERGLRFDDPTLRISWPFPPVVISDKDRAHPDYDPGRHLYSE